jgi:rhodanese-related sulfurtransferase
MVASIKPEQFAAEFSAESIVVDARKTTEYQAEHVENAINIPLDTINSNFAAVPKNETFYLHCAGGYRSVIMASILKSRGYHNLINVEKGINGIRNAGVALSQFICPSTQK